MSPMYLLASFYDFSAPNLFLLLATATCRHAYANVSEVNSLFYTEHI